MEFYAIGLFSKDRSQLVILCPFCGEIHMHGAVGYGSPWGSRAPHCNVTFATWPGSYTVIQAPTEQVEEVLRASLKKRAAKKGVIL